MKVVILAGGLGTRLGDLTELLPKPMVNIGHMPIIWHIMKIYSSYGFNEFIVALGYKSYAIKKYFSNFLLNTSDCEIDLSDGSIKFFNGSESNWKITLVDTGLDTMTGGRVKRLKEFLHDETFMMTYGDGVSDLNIQKLVDFHKQNKKYLTVTAVRPIARFGELRIKNKLVENFYEKPQISDGWVNGGFFVLEPSVIDYIKDDSISWEKEPLEKLAKEGELKAYKHYDFWQPMDTLREKIKLEKMWLDGTSPWKVWE